MFLKAKLPEGRRPQIIIGHDRVSGGCAYVQASEYFPEAALVFFIHTMPHEIEFLKKKPDAASVAETKDQQLSDIAALADVVAAVGPRLQRGSAGLIDDGHGGRLVVRVDPGIELRDTRTTSRKVGPSCICLVLGRANDKHEYELKGIDIAAGAFSMLLQGLRGTLHPELWVRGAEPGHGGDLQARMAKTFGIHRASINVREYTSDPAKINEDLKRASVLMMPSRAEGFGLVGLEAIAQGTPVLITSESGLAELLTEKLGPGASDFIVPVTDNLSVDVKAWSEALARVLHDRDHSFRRAHELRRYLAARLPWERTVRCVVDASLNALSTRAKAKPALASSRLR